MERKISALSFPLFRPAISELIRHVDFFRIQKLCQFVSITESALDTFIEEAVRLHREEILSFFLEFQKTTLAFMTMTLPSDTDKE